MKLGKLSILLLSAALFAAACGVNDNKSAPAHPEWTYSSVVYEVNVRQFSPEGTFSAVRSQLPRLKKLGVDVLWLMPVYQIGEAERKGTLGSYYAISDYCKINPEFGTMADFDSLVDNAHKLGFKVILDWVANQTAPDHNWMREKPADFYERDSLGNAIYEYDWTDTRSLNYENEAVWAAQDSCMRFWLARGIDGFRLDAAGEVPAKFWKAILPKMNADFPEIYILAEAEKPELSNPDSTMDASYAWELHHLMNAVAQKKKGVSDIKEYIARDAERMDQRAFRLMFTSNHDENSWNGTEFERMGKGANAGAVLAFTLPQGQPLIYNGQEVGLNRRLEFFEKDPIMDWTPNRYTALFSSLTAMRHANRALDAGERGGKIIYPEVKNLPDSVLLFTREVKGNKVIVAVNLSDSDAGFTFDFDGKYSCATCSQCLECGDEPEDCCEEKSESASCGSCEGDEVKSTGASSCGSCQDKVYSGSMQIALKPWGWIVLTR